MEQIEIPKPELTPSRKANFATEVAFNSLVQRAGALGLSVTPVMGLVYLPDQAVTRQFQDACRAVLTSLGASF